MLGSAYLIEHCAAYLSRRNKIEALAVYVTDCLRISAMGMVANSINRFYDILYPAPVDNRSAGEIVADITARAGLRVVNQ